jgi:Secretion system C-terminal sorting domain
MRHRITLLLALFLSLSSGITAQRMKASIRAGNAANSAIITLQPNFNFNNKLNELGFVIMIPKESPPGTPITIPALQILSTCATCLNTTFPAATWAQITDAVSDPNFYLIRLGCVSTLGTSPVLVINSGIAQDAVEIQFSNSTITPTQIRLAHIADGGLGTAYGFNVIDGSSVDLTNYVQMFYGTGVVPTVPHPDEPTGYSNTQYVTISNILLPLNWLSFNVIKQGNDGLLNWIVANDGDNHHYELQRSANGTSDFKTIASVNKSASADYKYTDAGINNLGASVLYYRIKQVDVNGRTSYSDIRQLRLDVKGNQISVFPNPVEKGFYVNIPFTNTDNKKIRLNLVAATGQTVVSREITTAQASNYYFDIRDKNLAAGSYNLQIVFEDKTTETKKLNIIR